MKRSASLCALTVLAAAGALAQPRVLAVTGRGSAPYTPEFVDLYFAVSTADRDYAEVQNANLRAVEAAMGALTTIYGIKREDITSLDYRLDEDLVYENGKQERRGYVSSTRMKVRVRELGTYRSIIASLLDAGVNGIDSIAFGVEDWEALRQQALVAAYSDAERKARALAERAQVKLGKPLQIREGSAGAPAPQPLAKAAFRAEAAGNGQVLSAGSPLFEAEVYVEYELLK